MRARGPVTQTTKASEARQRFGHLLDQAASGDVRVVVERGGVPVAAMISMDDLLRLAQLDAQREDDFKALDATREAFKDVPDAEIEREVARAISEIRARDRRAEQRAARTA